ncbi:MAG: hypothetical protein ACXVI9_13065 [Mucilaginibacter sp.]
MTRAYQSISVPLYRWMFKNFGQGKLPRFKSMFNVSFLLIVMLTAALLLTQVVLRSGLFAVNVYGGTAIMLGAVFFIFVNHLIFLNNKWFSKVNARMVILGKHNLNLLSLVVLIHVILVCGFLIFAAR